MRSTDGHPLKGANVALTIASAGPGAPTTSTPPRLVALARTGPDGRFRVEALSAAVYRVTAAAPGFPASRAPINLEAGHQLFGIDLALAKGGTTLSGHVYDLGGGAIPNAKVRVWIDGNWSTSASLPVALAVADPDGGYRLTLPAGNHTALAEAAGYAPERASVALLDTQVRDFRLQPASAIAGRVLRKGTVAPVPNADPGREPRRPRRGPKRCLGRIRPGGSRDRGLRALRRLGRSGRPRHAAGGLVALGERTDGVVIEVGKGRVLSGRVHRHDGTPVANARVQLDPAAPFAGGSTQARKTGGKTVADDGEAATGGVGRLPNRGGVARHVHAHGQRPGAGQRDAQGRGGGHQSAGAGHPGPANRSRARQGGRPGGARGGRDLRARPSAPSRFPPATTFSARSAPVMTAASSSSTSSPVSSS